VRVAGTHNRARFRFFVSHIYCIVESLALKICSPLVLGIYIGNLGHYIMKVTAPATRNTRRYMRPSRSSRPRNRKHETLLDLRPGRLSPLPMPVVIDGLRGCEGICGELTSTCGRRRCTTGEGWSGHGRSATAISCGLGACVHYGPLQWKSLDAAPYAILAFVPLAKHFIPVGTVLPVQRHAEGTRL
jgi:hypothetical protein